MSAAEAPRDSWLYEGGAWRWVPDPVDWGDEFDVLAGYARAGYGVGAQGGEEARSLLWVGDPEGEYVELFDRPEPPQCILQVGGADGVVPEFYIAALPDALDIMARWAPLVRAAAECGTSRDEAAAELARGVAARRAARGTR